MLVQVFDSHTLSLPIPNQSDDTKRSFKEFFYGFALDSSFRLKMAKVEVDLVKEAVVSWESLSDFSVCPEFASNKLYNFGDFNTYLGSRFTEEGKTLYGGLVLHFASKQTLVLTGSVKKFDKVNSNNSEVNFVVHLHYASLEWSAVFKSESHNFEESGQIMKHSKMYLSAGSTISLFDYYLVYTL